MITDDAMAYILTELWEAQSDPLPDGFRWKGGKGTMEVEFYGSAFAHDLAVRVNEHLEAEARAARERDLTWPVGPRLSDDARKKVCRHVAAKWPTPTKTAPPCLETISLWFLLIVLILAAVVFFSGLLLHLSAPKDAPVPHAPATEHSATFPPAPRPQKAGHAWINGKRVW